MSIVMEDSEAITVDIFFGGLGKAGEAVTSPAQTALLDAFQAAGNVNDLAARLGIPIQFLAVTGVKVVSAYGYDGYKISIAIRSDDPNAVAKELFTTAIGKVVGVGLTPLSAPLMKRGLGGIAAGVAIPLVGDAVASSYAGGVWDDHVANSQFGSWSTSQLTDTFGIGVKVTAGTDASNNRGAFVPPANQVPNSLLAINPTTNSQSIFFNQSPVLQLPPIQITGDYIYIVQPGDSLWKIAQKNGWDFNELRDVNSQLSDPNFIRPGQEIFGLPPASVDNKVDIRTNTGATSSVSTQDATAALNANGTFSSSGNYLATMDAFRLNFESTYGSALIGGIGTGGFRPGAMGLSNIDSQSWGLEFAARSLGGYQGGSSQSGQVARAAGALTNFGLGQRFIPADPMILDLNGDGVTLVNFSESTAFFDIDNDGGSREQTGWVKAVGAATDGILVHDLNNDGVINGIQETLSEYYNGVTGTGGNTGTRPYADGFVALKALDSNGDNLFNNLDAGWSQLRVWVDQNGDGLSFIDSNDNGIKDSTELSELRTFAELGITSINLTKSAQSGLVNTGNEVLATGSFIRNGLTAAAQAVRFIANPSGTQFSKGLNGTTLITQGSSGASSVRSFVSESNTNQTLSVTTLNVQNIYAGGGNDSLVGDSGANWLVGGLGSDTFSAGDGDDVLLIDAEDVLQNIHAGAGTDVIQVVGERGVAFDMAQAQAEVFVGGTGADIVYGGGRQTMFVRGGAGDDILIGGGANDVLSGEDGDDRIEGGAGNDLIRGHRGRDHLAGDNADDVLDGGLEDDVLEGGSGNDVLIGGGGDDTFDGGDGIDVAEYSGSYADYRISKLNSTTWRVVDTRSGQDGADTLSNIEKLSFSDVSRVDLTIGSPLPVKDILTSNSSGQLLSRTVAQLISKAQLLGNDRDWDSNLSQLVITEVLEAQGGTVSLNASGDVLFTPDANYTGVMSFKYRLSDEAGQFTNVTNTATGQTEAMKAVVYLQTPDLPSDPLAVEQWYLSDINVIPVWKDYTGLGVRIGQFEPGSPYATGPEIFDYRHPDLQPNADKAWLNTLDALGNNDTPQTASNHATMVAGVMVAARNGQGGIGVAYNATLAGHYIQGDGLELSQLSTEITAALAKFKDYDVVNNSWGAASNFLINVAPAGTLQTGILNAVSQGRKGLGTVVVMAGGNDRQGGANTNYSALTANRAVITTGSINAASDLGTLQLGMKPFSNPGASILVSAPGSNIDSTSRQLIADNGSTLGSNYATSEGTSFAAPIVSGLVALMLEANSRLGYRDIQSILAMTATKVDDPNGTDWVYNSARNWNGGGMHTSHDYGFGEVDARAAVRLAETWHTQSVYLNEVNRSASSAALGVAIPDNGTTLSRTLSMASGLTVESAQVTVALTHQYWGDLIIKLISPSGTESVLVNRSGKALGSGASDRGDSISGTMNFSFNSTHLRGEDSGGVWTLQVIDAVTGETGTLSNWKLDLYGALEGVDDVYVYTNEFASFAGTARNTLADSDGGVDILNASAATGNSTINLNAGVLSTIAGKSLTITGTLEKVYAGDGNDTLTGNALDNVLVGGRGNDTLNGGAGSDRLEGGQGNDSLTGGLAEDLFIVRREVGSTDTITDFNSASGIEKIVLVGFTDVPDFTAVTLTQVGTQVRINLGQGQTLLVNNTTVAALSEQNFTFITTPHFLEEYVARWVNPRRTAGTAGADNLLLPGGADLSAFGMGGDDLISAISPNDLLDGGDGNDQLLGDEAGYTPYPGTDWIEGGAGNDFLDGGDGDDMLVGGSGLDSIYGQGGNDYLIGGSGDDYLDGGVGDDIVTLDGDAGMIDGANYAFLGNRVGGVGGDIFRVLTNGGAQAGHGSSGAQIGAYNLIVDFNPNQAGEQIDLSAFSWVDSFNDLAFEDWSVGSVSMVTISSVQGTTGAYVTLHGISSSQLRTDHFIYAKGLAGSIEGTVGNDTLTGNAGANTIDGLAGADSMTGRTGDDTYIVDNIGDQIYELPGGGYDSVLSSVGHTLSANVEALTLVGSASLNGTGNNQRNRLTGNAGNNRLDGGAEADEMVGGAGNDVYVVDSQLDSVTENANSGTDRVEASVSWTLGKNIENLTLTGTTHINATGNEVSNTLIGNSGDNILDGAQGADTMVGGLGDDTYYLDHTGDVVSEALNSGYDTLYSSVNVTLGNNVEKVMLFGSAVSATGNTLDNFLIGNSLANTLSGAAGDDTLDGREGADAMNGGAGNDTYFIDNLGDTITELASEGVDTVVSSISLNLATLGGGQLENALLTGTANLNLTGNALNNVLTGNAGNNTLSGGAGNDTYTLGRGDGTDRIVETDVATGNTDIASFGSGVTTEQLWFRQISNDLEVSIIGTSDKFLVNNWYLGNHYQVEQFQVSDGQTLLSTQVQNLVQAMAAFAPPASGQFSLPSNYASVVQPVIAANWQ
ncbi:S8 family serine peptidase [Pseudomonas veronii]|uniref:S8 family serine peptidase n=1 Tax=Pseudomonas veronii TaxID=76761 RepID=UPI0009D50016|nr:hypothetical protein BZ164_19990 [Pseudomonas veronii]